jgi:hypothetical protein
LTGLGFISSIQAAFLVLSSASAWTGIVSPRFGTALGILGLHHLHQSLRGVTRASKSRQASHVWAAVLKEAFITGTQIVKTDLPIRGLQNSIFWAPSIAHGQNCTFPAITRQLIQLRPAKGSLCRAFEQRE